MPRGRKQVVWVLAACAALFAQVTPRAPCHACDKPCCGDQAREPRSQTCASDDDRAIGCPLCAAAVADGAGEPHRAPCRCHLTARHDQPLSATSATPAVVGADSVAVGLPAPRLVVPQALGVSRDYVATLLGIPIRPPRILFGVWRN